jgi:hypothetical protein
MANVQLFQHEGDVQREFENVYQALSLFSPSEYTTAERDALEAKEGQLITNSTTNKLNVYLNGAWEVITSA